MGHTIPKRNRRGWNQTAADISWCFIIQAMDSVTKKKGQKRFPQVDFRSNPINKIAAINENATTFQFLFKTVKQGARLNVLVLVTAAISHSF